MWALKDSYSSWLRVFVFDFHFCGDFNSLSLLYLRSDIAIKESRRRGRRRGKRVAASLCRKYTTKISNLLQISQQDRSPRHIIISAEEIPEKQKRGKIRSN